MMRYNPTLIVKRVIVERNGKAVYDEKFHSGVNVIRGDNSSGKSTVLNFIFYGLGGDYSDWSAVARLCERVIIEVSINGNLATLSRDISLTSGQQPMEIFGGSYELSQVATRQQWTRYPYKTAGRESFSQAMFRLMGIPEVSSDLSGHITMHQVLRLLYADQLSPVESIFRADSFDRADLRDTVGRLLCGAYDSVLYNNEQAIRALTKDFDTINGQLKSLYSILGGANQAFTYEWVEEERKKIDAERIATQQAVEEAEKRLFATIGSDRLTLDEQNKAYLTVRGLQEELGIAKTERDAVALAVADSNAFISSLNNKIEALGDSSRVLEHIGDVKFQVCPACFAATDHDAPHACHLCKTPFESEHTRARIAALIMDAGIQVKQSEQIQSRRLARLLELNGRVQELEARWSQASARLSALQRMPSGEARNALRKLNQRSGYLDRQLEDLEQKAMLVSSIRQLAERKEELNNSITKLKSHNDALRAEQKKHLSIAFTRIGEEVKTLLQNDLRRQDIFEDPQHIDFSFAGNRIYVDDENYFSASSRAILKSSFCLGFLAAATKTDFFRHPRFCMIDTHENMGVEAIRSQNFQLQILKVSKESLVEHQIIYATAMIEPGLEDDAYTVGAFSTSDEMTIAIQMQ